MSRTHETETEEYHRAEEGLPSPVARVTKNARNFTTRIELLPESVSELSTIKYS